MIDISLENFFTIGIIAAIFSWLIKFLLAYFKVSMPVKA